MKLFNLYAGNYLIMLILMVNLLSLLKADPPPGKNWQLIWNDEFEGTEIDSTKCCYSANHISAPDRYERKKAKRLLISDTFFRMEKVSETHVRFIFNGRFVPRGVPAFLAKTWFPEGPVDMLNSIIALSKK